MKLNISCPATGCQKAIAIDDDKKLSIFYGRRMGQEVDGDALGDEFKGYSFKITGGNDKDGFSMKQGVLVQGRVRLLMGAGHKCYRPRRAGERKRKSVRGCIVGPDLSVIALAIVKTGEEAIAGLTDTKQPKRLGPKRATKIRKLFALTKEDDVRRFVIRRKIEKEGKPVRYKAPRIQRLVTDARLRRKRIYKASKKARWERTRKAVSDYQKVLEEYRKKRAAHQKEEIQHKKELAHQRHVKQGDAPTPATAGKKTTATTGTTQDKKGQQTQSTATTAKGATTAKTSTTTATTQQKTETTTQKKGAVQQQAPKTTGAPAQKPAPTQEKKPAATQEKKPAATQEKKPATQQGGKGNKK